MPALDLQKETAQDPPPLNHFPKPIETANLHNAKQVLPEEHRASADVSTPVPAARLALLGQILQGQGEPERLQQDH
jgi:hypothetical protein